MFDLEVENKTGQKITLTHNENYTISEIVGLNPPSATINTSIIAGFDGAKLNSTRVDMRQIEIYLNIEKNVAASRIDLYRVFKSKQYIKLHYTNEYRDVYIEGYVQNFSIEYFSSKQLAQIVIICPEPYFKDIDELIIDSNIVDDKFSFPFGLIESGETLGEYFTQLDVNIINDSDVDAGFTMELRASSEVINPKIINRNNLEYFGINYTMQEGDMIRITSYQGNKTVKLTRNGTETNIFNYIIENSTWLQLIAREENVFTYTADSGLDYLDIRFIHRNLFEGV